MRKLNKLINFNREILFITGRSIFGAPKTVEEKVAVCFAALKIVFYLEKTTKFHYFCLCSVWTVLRFAPAPENIRVFEGIIVPNYYKFRFSIKILFFSFFYLKKNHL